MLVRVPPLPAPPGVSFALSLFLLVIQVLGSVRPGSAPEVTTRAPTCSPQKHRWRTVIRRTRFPSAFDFFLPARPTGALLLAMGLAPAGRVPRPGSLLRNLKTPMFVLVAVGVLSVSPRRGPLLEQSEPGARSGQGIRAQGGALAGHLWLGKSGRDEPVGGVGERAGSPPGAARQKRALGGTCAEFQDRGSRGPSGNCPGRHQEPRPGHLPGLSIFLPLPLRLSVPLSLSSSLPPPVHFTFLGIEFRYAFVLFLR